MKIKVICIGKSKERYWTEAGAEYIKRLKSYCDIEIRELKEARLPGNAGEAEEKAVKRAEGESILKEIKKDDYVVALEIRGKSVSSVELAKQIERLALEGKSNVVFVIGGSLGLGEAVSLRADMSLSFSAMTFPHQMMKVILLEQIYRSFKIIKNEKYHK